MGMPSTRRYGYIGNTRTPTAFTPPIVTDKYKQWQLNTEGHLEITLFQHGDGYALVKVGVWPGRTSLFFWQTRPTEQSRN